MPCRGHGSLNPHASSQLERDAVGYMKMYAKYMEKIEESREGSKTVTIVVDPITVDRW